MHDLLPEQKHQRHEASRLRTSKRWNGPRPLAHAALTAKAGAKGIASADHIIDGAIAHHLDERRRDLDFNGRAATGEEQSIAQ
jgi:hypothetical protein